MTPAQLKTYLEKIGFRGDPLPTLAHLTRIVEGHIFTFPFETIDLHDSTLDKLPNRGITFDFDTHFDRAIKDNRGGHCAVLNLLLLKALETVGFKVMPILPDTLRQLKEDETPSQHCAGIVSLAEGDYLVDAGFGGVGLLSPIPLKVGEYQQYSEKFKITLSEKYDFEIYIRSKDDWECIYGVLKKPSTYQDFAKVNQYQSSPQDPDCSFSLALLCTKPFKIDETHNGRRRLFNTKFTQYENDRVVKEHKVGTQQRFWQFLKSEFNIDLTGHQLRISKLSQEEYSHSDFIKPVPAPVTPVYGTRRKQSAVKFRQRLPTVRTRFQAAKEAALAEKTKLKI